MTNTIPPTLLSALTTIGLALTHFIWQGAVVALVLAIVLRLLRKRSAGVRYAASVGALGLMALLPAITLWHLRAGPHDITIKAPPAARVEAAPPVWNGPLGSAVQPSPDVANSTPLGPVADFVDSGGTRNAAATNYVNPISTATGKGAEKRFDNAHFEQALSIAAIMWAIGVLALAVRLTVGWIGLYRLRRRDTEPLQADAACLVDKLCSQLGLSNVRVLATRAWDEPVAFGLWRPVVLMPVSVLTQCPAEMIEALIAHELAHIRRHDLWVNLFQRIVETILFYHPAVWWVSGRIRSERELCCDDLAVCTTQKRADYAAALVEIARLTRPAAKPALAAGVIGPRLSMLDRARRVLRMPGAGMARPRTSFWIAGPLSLFLAAGIALLAVTSPSQTSAASSATQPNGATTDAATEHLLRPPPESRTYVFDWQDTPLPEVLRDFSEMAGLSIRGLAEMPGLSRAITYQSVRPLAFDEALLLLNQLLEPYRYWMVRRDDFLDLKLVTEFYPGVPTENMFNAVADYRKAKLPDWEWASVLYRPLRADPQFLASYAMDNTPDNMARAIAHGPYVESRGSVHYINRQLELMERMDTATPAPASKPDLLSTPTTPAGFLPSTAPADRPGSTPLDVSKDSAGRTRYLIRSPGDGVITEIHHQIGDQVQAGDVLAELDNEEIKIELQAAKVRLKPLERQAQIEQGVNDEIGRLAAEEALELAELEVKRLELRLSRTLIVAPASGKLERAPRSRAAGVQPPEYRHNARVNTGDPLLVLVEEAVPASQPDDDPHDDL